MSGERVLVVDDGKENRDFIVEYVLEPNGFKPIIARDGLEGLELTRQHHPDLILLDLQMPRMNGMEFLDAINAEQIDIPVILMTFHGSEEIAVEVYRKGVKDYVKKPYTIEEMYEAIERSLGIVRLRKDKDDLTNRVIQANTTLNQRMRELKVLNSIGKGITAEMDREALMRGIAEAAARLTSCEESAVYLREGNNLSLQALWRQADNQAYSTDEVREDALAVKAIRAGKAVVFEFEELAQLRRNNPSAPSAGMATPLLLGKRPVGALVVKNFVAGSRVFTQHDGSLLSALADYAAIAYQNSTILTESNGPAGAIHRAVPPSLHASLPPIEDLNGQRRFVSVLAIRIGNYQDFARKAPAAQITTLMNNYFQLAIQAIMQYDGTLIQHSGDSLLAVYNAPLDQENHTLRAAYTATAIQQGVQALNEQRGGGLSTQLALHVGDVVVGYFGIQSAMIYTAIGETIQITQDVLAGTPTDRCMITAESVDLLGNTVKIDTAQNLPTLAKRDTITVFELLGISAG